MVRKRIRIKTAAPTAGNARAMTVATALAGAVLAAIALLASGCAATAAAEGGPCADLPLARAAARARSAPRLLTPAAEDSVLRAEGELPTAVKVGRWARRFAAADSVVYLFGLSEGGYARGGEIVDDLHVDCVSLLYRCAELAHATSSGDAVARALATRFAGVPRDALVDEQGRVDYDRPEHLDFSLDMIRSGHWGRNVSGEFAGAVRDSTGSARYAAGSFSFVPTAALDSRQLREGDVVWFVLEPGQSLRTVQGAVIGHIGIVVVDGATPVLVHAASKDLPGVYRGGTVVMVPLQIYLEKISRFCGVMITRFDRE